MSATSTSHHGRIDARIACDGASRSRLVALQTGTPLKLAPARTRTRDGAAELVVMECSPGLFPGDRYDLAWNVDAGARVRIGTQAHLRVHGGPAETPEVDGARLDQRIVAGDGALVELRPEPVALHERSMLDARLDIDLAGSAAAIVADVVAAGRIAHGERLRFASWRSSTDVRIDGRLVAASRQQLEPARTGLDVAAALAGGATHWATLNVACAALDADRSERLRADLQQHVDDDPRVAGAVDLLDRAGVVVQLRADAAQPLVELLDALADVARCCVDAVRDHGPERDDGRRGNLRDGRSLVG